MEQLMLIGVAVVFIGIFIIIIGSLMGAGDGKTGAKVAVGGFIGPIPFGFANDKPLLYVVMAAAVILFVVSLMFSQKII